MNPYIYIGVMALVTLAVRALVGLKPGLLPLLLSVLLFCTGLVLLSLGILGEYLLTIRAKVMRRPLVIEECRINFDEQKKE